MIDKSIASDGALIALNGAMRKNGLCILVLAIVPGLMADTVSWSAIQHITSNSDIVNPGSIVQALDFGGSAAGSSSINVTVGANTVHFVTAQSPFPNANYADYFFNGSGTSVDANFDKVLDTPAYGFGSSYTIPFTGLSAGLEYNLQVFISDQGGANWSTRFGVSGVSTVLGTQTSFGEFATADIILGAGETSFNLNVSNINLAIVNAVVLSTVGDSSPAVPEPATLLLVTVGLLGIRRFRPSRP